MAEYGTGKKMITEAEFRRRFHDAQMKALDEKRKGDKMIIDEKQGHIENKTTGKVYFPRD